MRGNLGGTLYYLEVSEDDATDLAGGFVPKAVQAQAAFAVNQFDIDRRRAERPVRGEKKSSKSVDVTDSK